MAAAYDLVIIGAGPAGEVGAIRAAQLGLKVALVDKREDLGGTCLNVGCIPTKALLYAAKTWDKLHHLEEVGFSLGTPGFDWQKILARKDSIVAQMRKGLKFLMKKNKVTVVAGTAQLQSPTEVLVKDATGASQVLTTRFVLLATGSRVKELPFAKTNGTTVQSSDHILSIAAVPKTLCVVGGGVVGMEFASLFGRMGSQVTVVEYAPQILPFEDQDVVKEAVRAFQKQNITVETGAELTGVTHQGSHARVSVKGKPDRDFEVVLMAVGRSPVTAELNLDKLGIKSDQGGYVEVNSHYQTAKPQVYAVGDILKTPALAHTASAEAIYAVEHMAGHHPQAINYAANPSAIYTYPEIAHIGLTEAETKAKGIDYGVAKFPFSALAKANIEQATVGFVKLIYDNRYREVLGAHIIGATATEMIAELALAKVLEATVDEIAQTIHPHPTLSETVMEAAHLALGGAIHM